MNIKHLRDLICFSLKGGHVLIQVLHKHSYSLLNLFFSVFLVPIQRL